MHFKKSLMVRLLQGAAISIAALASASAFALTPGSGTWVAQTNKHGMPEVHVYVPKNTAPKTIGTGRALMVTLHGCGMTAGIDVIQQASTKEKRFNWEGVAEEHGMVVVAPSVPSGTTATRKVSGCWDWFGFNHSRTTRDEAKILAMVEDIASRPELNIDRKQIYISGLSAGGGLVVDLGCVAPDVFAGIGVNAAPVLNETSTTPGSAPTTTPEQIAGWCKQYAGSYLDQLTKKQMVSVVHGTTDTMVNPKHGEVMKDAYKLMLGATTSNGQFSEVKTTGETWKDADGNTRLSYMTANGMGHAWPGGAELYGDAKTPAFHMWIKYDYVHYPRYLTKFFFENNPHFKVTGKPVVQECKADVASITSDAVTISGKGYDTDGTIVGYKVVIKGPTSKIDTTGNGTSFSKQYTGLADGAYAATVTAIDNEAKESDVCGTSFYVGQIVIDPPKDVKIDGKTTDSITLSWANVDAATSYVVNRTGGSLGAKEETIVEASGTRTSFRATGLEKGTTYTFTVRSVTAENMRSQPSASVEETTSTWVCTNHFSSNYKHVVESRAYVLGGYAYAKGSNQRMGMYNTFYTSNLAQTQQDYYVVGTCPTK